MATQVITGVLTYSSVANRDAALTRINTALVGYTYVNFTSAAGTGLSTSGNSVNISIQVDDLNLAFDIARAVYDAAVSTNRQTSGWFSVNRI